jgi:molecular chaperone DnaK
VPQIEVAFDIDANGIVNVSARDKGTGKEQQIRIQASGGLSDVDIERMVKDAEEHAVEDKQRRETVETKNQAEALIHQTERSMSEHGDKLAAADKSKIEADLAALKEAAEGDDSAAIRTKLEALATSAMKLGEAIYKAEQGGSEAENAAGSGQDDTVVDADFEEVDDDEDRKGRSSAS